MEDTPLLRDRLYPGEDEYFKKNTRVAGMAAEDGKVILNPYSTINDSEKRAVYLNEASRLWMRDSGTPKVNLTEAQNKFLDGTTYKDAGPDDRVATILARVISGDPTAGDFTPEQKAAADEVFRQMNGGALEDGYNGTDGSGKYGQRVDGTQKDLGFFGELKRPDGDISTELSIGVNIGGKEQEIPMLVPTLSRSEIDHLLNGGEPTEAIVSKAVQHAMGRLEKGLSPFATEGEQVSLPGSEEAMFAAGFNDKETE